MDDSWKEISRMNPFRKDHARLFGWAVAIITCCCLFLSCTQIDKSVSTGSMNIEPTMLLLDVIQALIDHNSDYLQIISTMDTVGRERYEQLVDSLIEHNEANPEISARIDQLLGTEAYQLYYRQFRNIGPDDHRRILCALPYVSIRSPADVSQNLFELSRHLDSVRYWVDSIISRIDIQRSHRTALKWLPEGEYTLPRIHFIFDGNGGAFAREGEVVFDLYGVLLSGQPHDSRFMNLGEIGTQEVEEVLAHECHHVYARPFLGQNVSALFDDWRDQWQARVTLRMVSEGVAMHCNPPQGFSQAIKEDTAIVAYWIRRLNEKLSSLKSGTATEEELQGWLSGTYQDEARQLLKEYLQRDCSGNDLQSILARHVVDRPTFIYTLGWWMASRISGYGAKPEELTALLADPYSLFARYNEVIGNAPDSLAVRE